MDQRLHFIEGCVDFSKVDVYNFKKGNLGKILVWINNRR